MDTMQMIASPVRTICMGMCASMGALMLSHGDKGEEKSILTVEYSSAIDWGI